MSDRKDEFEAACKSPEAMLEYLHKKALGHQNYRIYVDETKLNYWVETGAIYLSNGKKWNDVDDRNRFNSNSAIPVNFGICFTFSRSENVAMWMLYGGMEKKGVMVDFKPTVIKTIIGINEIHLGYWVNRRFNRYRTLSKEEFTIELTDILYCACSDSMNVVKRSDARCELQSKELIDQLKWRRKDYPWCYENECRLVVSIDEKVINEIINDECSEMVFKDFVIQIDVGNVFDDLNIYRAPNNNSVKYQSSNLKAKIDWDLCKGCNIKRKMMSDKSY